MKLDNKLIILAVLLLVSISVSANNSSYQNIPESLKNLSISECKKHAKTFFDANGKEVSRFNLPQNKINRAIRNNKRLYLYMSGVVKSYSFETAENSGNPFIINCKSWNKKKPSTKPKLKPEPEALVESLKNQLFLSLLI